MAKKLLAGFVASLLVLVVCAAAIIGLVHSSKKAASPLHTTSKAMLHRSSLCATALHKESCELMLTQLQRKSLQGRDSRFDSSLAQSASVQTEIFKSFIEVTLHELQAAVNRSAVVGSGALTGRTAAEVSDCEKLLIDALESTKAAVALLGDKDIESLTAEADNIVHMLTASMTFMYTCVDGLGNSKMNSDMDRILRNATVTSSNALGVINSISSSSVVRPKSLQGTSRKLQSAAAQRKLLEAAIAKPNMTVAADGSSDYKTITDAIKNIPSNYTDRYVIYVKAGIYEEMVMVPREKANLTMYGDGMEKTIITGSMSDKGATTKLQSVLAVEGAYFMAKDMGFRNTAGPNGFPAVAVRTSAEYITFYNCKIDGHQDTLYTHTGRQFFRDCTISGTIDFIFGNAAVVFQNCKIVVNKPAKGQQNVITANGRTDPNMKTGIVFHNCEIEAAKDFEAEKATTVNYLGRPWKEYSRTVIMESTIGDLIDPEGWMAWMNTTVGQSTLSYSEFGNKGPGAATEKRVTWPGFHVITKSDAAQYTVASFINDNQWLDSTGITNTAGLMS